MPAPPPPFSGRFTASVAGRSEDAGPDASGAPALSIVEAGEQTFTWELRRSGGALLERGIEGFPSRALAQAAGETVLATLCASPSPRALERRQR